MAKRIGRAASGHAVQLFAETLEGIAIVVNRIGAGQQFARFGEKDHHAAHHQASRRNVDVARCDGDAFGAQMVDHLAGIVDDVLHSLTDPFTEIGRLLSEG